MSIDETIGEEVLCKENSKIVKFAELYHTLWTNGKK